MEGGGIINFWLRGNWLGANQLGDKMTSNWVIHVVPLIVQSIYYFNPSQIATEGFSSPFISLKYTDQHMKSLEKSKKGKIHFFYRDNIALDGSHENEAVYINLFSYVFL